jgi:hypothetical protein
LIYFLFYLIYKTCPVIGLLGFGLGLGLSFNGRWGFGYWGFGYWGFGYWGFGYWGFNYWGFGYWGFGFGFGFNYRWLQFCS